MNVFFEAVIVGIVIVVVGTLVSWIFGSLFKVDLPPVCKDWNKNYAMEITLFLTGFFAHLLFEVFGANAWYCRNGNACKIGL